MGLESTCILRIDGQTTRGKAVLEHKDLIVRGPIRLAVPLTDITEATAREGTLVVRFGARRVELHIGDAAARWAQRITNPPSRLAKLGVKPGMRIALVGLHDPAFATELVAAGATVLGRPSAGVDAVFLGAAKPSDLYRLASLARVIQPAGAVWVVRRKGQTAVSERESMAAGKRAGLVDVKVVSFSETHTAEKYMVPRRARPAKPVAPRSAPRPPASRAPRKRGSAPSRGRS